MLDFGGVHSFQLAQQSYPPKREKKNILPSEPPSKSWDVTTPENDHMTIAGKSTIFNRKYIDSFMVDSPSSHVSFQGEVFDIFG